MLGPIVRSCKETPAKIRNFDIKLAKHFNVKGVKRPVQKKKDYLKLKKKQNKCQFLNMMSTCYYYYQVFRITNMFSVDIFIGSY